MSEIKNHCVRIIPRLDVKGNNLVKGIHLEGLRVLGDPYYYAKSYYEGLADELLYVDVVASLYGRNSLEKFVERASKDIYIPLTVAGGIRTIEDIQKLLGMGADKVSMNTAVIKDPGFIEKAAKKFGSSTIVVNIEAIKQPGGNYLAFMENGREKTDLDVGVWAKRVEELGAGEILLTSVDQEGTGKGFDLDLIALVTSQTKIPVVACGGAGSKEDVLKAIRQGAHSVAIASIFHYQKLKTMPKYETTHEGNTDFISKGVTSFGRFELLEILELKKYLMEHGINCRL